MVSAGKNEIMKEFIFQTANYSIGGFFYDTYTQSVFDLKYRNYT